MDMDSIENMASCHTNPVQANSCADNTWYGDELGDQTYDRGARSPQDTSSCGLGHRSVEPLPDRPPWSTQDIFGYHKGGISLYEAAGEISQLWEEWSTAAEAVLLAMAKRLQTHRLPAEDLVYLMYAIEKFEGRPRALPPQYGNNEEKRSDIVNRVCLGVTVDWTVWANQVQGIWEILAEKIAYGDHEKHGNAADTPTSDVEANLSNLSLSSHQPFEKASPSSDSISTQSPITDLGAVIVAMMARQEQCRYERMFSDDDQSQEALDRYENLAAQEETQRDSDEASDVVMG